MFKTLVLNIFLFLTVIASGQGDFHKTLSGSDEYSEWLSASLAKLSTQLNLTDLSDLQQGVHYRIWFEGQVIDVSRDPENNFDGRLINFANTASYMKKEQVESHSSTEKINPHQAEQIFDLLKEYQKVDYQNVWRNNKWDIDNVKLLFIVESSVDGHYSFQEVWVPKTGAKHQKEVKQLMQFAGSCSELLGLKTKFESFFGKLPNACYVTSVHTFLCKNDKNSERVNQWLLSNQPVDSMIAYLNEKDWRYMATANDWVLYNRVVVFFDKKGKIGKVDFEIQSGTIYADDLYSKSIRRLKKQVKKVLLKLDFSLFRPPENYEFNIALTYHSSKKELIWHSW